MSSLVSMALRMCARRLLDGATFAGGHVHDSAIAPIDHMVGRGGDEPFIVVSTEDEEAAINLRDVNGGERSIDLVIEIAIAHAMSATAPGDAGEQEIVIPSTDAALELSLSLINRQVMRALFEKGGDPWCDLFRTFCIGLRKTTNRRGVGSKDGSRFAARQIILTIRPLDEPNFGHVPAADEPWGKLVALMDADPELAGVSPLVKAAITGEPEIENWDRGRSDQGLTHAAAGAIGIGAAGLPGEEPSLANVGAWGE